MAFGASWWLALSFSQLASFTGFTFGSIDVEFAETGLGLKS